MTILAGDTRPPKPSKKKLEALRRWAEFEREIARQMKQSFPAFYGKFVSSRKKDNAND